MSVMLFRSRYFAAKFSRSLDNARENEQVPAEQKPFLIIFTKWLDYPMTSKNASFKQSENQN